jgi:hypothetical protein
MPKYGEWTDTTTPEVIEPQFAEMDAFAPMYETTTTSKKLQTLEEKKQAKLNRLGSNNQYSNLSDDHTVMPGGNIESNKNKIWNDLSGAQIQDAISDAANQQVYRRDDGSMFQYDAAGKEVDFKGDVRRAYMYGTKGDSDAVKFGLARGDLDSSDARYVPGMVEGYGWDAGEEGVDINKNYMDMLLPYETATALEGMVHGRKEGMEDRKYPDYLSDEALQHASGVSEYYNTAEGMLGDTSGMTKEELEAADTSELGYYSKQPEAKNARSRTAEDILRAYEKKEREGMSVAEVVADEAQNTVSGIASGVFKGAIDLVDARDVQQSDW